MLHNVSIAKQALCRNVVLNHPNSMNVEVYRLKVTRKDSGMYAGDPTLGGAGSLDESDEDEYEYVRMGYGYALAAENFAPAPMVDLNDANIGSKNEFRYLIECEAQSGEDDWFDIHSHDLVFFLLGDDPDTCAKLAFEVTGRDTNTNIPPYNIVYTLQRRDELHVKEGGELLHP